MNTTSYGRSNVRKHKDINNFDQYIILEIYYKLNCLDKRKVKYSESRGYMGRIDKGLTTSLALRNKIPYKKQKSGFSITDIINQHFRKLLNRFKINLI